MKCEEQVTYGGQSRRCTFTAKYHARRKSDRDVRRVCGTHRNQLERHKGWAFKPIT